MNNAYFPVCLQCQWRIRGEGGAPGATLKFSKNDLNRTPSHKENVEHASLKEGIFF